MERIHTINYKETSTRKINQYTWTGIVDKDGYMLSDTNLDIPCYWNWFSELPYDTSQYLIDSQERYKGVNTTLKSNFFKYVDPEVGIEYMNATGREHGKLSKANPETANLYVYITMEDAMYTNELFSNGILWMFTSLDNLNNYMPYIDSIRVMRLNHSFKELYPDANIELLKFDDIVGKHFELSSKTRPELSQKYIELSKKKFVTEKVKPQYWDNGMKIISKQESKTEQRKKHDLPPIWDYQFEVYDWIMESSHTYKEIKIKENTFDDVFSLIR